MTHSSRGTATPASTDSAPSALMCSDHAGPATDAVRSVSVETEPCSVASMSAERSLSMENIESAATPTMSGASASLREQNPSLIRRTLRWVSTHRRESAAAVLVLIMLGIFADGQAERSDSESSDQADELREVEELLADFGTETTAFDTPTTTASIDNNSPAGLPQNDSNSLTIPVTPGAGMQESGATTDAPAFASESGSYPDIASSESASTEGQGTPNISMADYAAGSRTSSSQILPEQQSIANATPFAGAPSNLAPSNTAPSGNPAGTRNRVSQIRFRGEIRPIRQ